MARLSKYGFIVPEFKDLATIPSIIAYNVKVLEGMIADIGDKDVTININTDMDMGCWDDEPEGITIDGGSYDNLTGEIIECGDYNNMDGEIIDCGEYPTQ